MGPPKGWEALKPGWDSGAGDSGLSLRPGMPAAGRRGRDRTAWAEPHGGTPVSSAVTGSSSNRRKFKFQCVTVSPVTGHGHRTVARFNFKP
eukprot:259013-Hanusia_phi.AAC.2